MKKHLLIALLLVGMVGLSSGLSVKYQGESYDLNLSEVQDRYNSNTEEVPPFVASIVGDQRINVMIDWNGEIRNFSIVLNGLRMETLEEGKMDNPSLRVKAEEEAVMNVLKAERPVPAIREELSKGRITYEVVGTKNQAKFFLARTALKVSKMLGIDLGL